MKEPPSAVAPSKYMPVESFKLQTEENQGDEGSHAHACGEDGIKGEDIVATAHGDVITIGGERSAVEFLIKMISKTYEIKSDLGRSRP